MLDRVPQAIEIAQNGLEDPPAPGWEGESISVLTAAEMGFGTAAPTGLMTQGAARPLRTGGWSYCAK
jgi:hypothetical protein